MSPLPDQEPPTVGHVTPRGAESEVDGAQLAILLQAASSIVDEEFRRAERLDNKARGQITIVGAFFAFVQTITAGALKSLGESESTAQGWLVWTLFAVAAVAAILLLVALVGSSFAWWLRKERALNPDDIVDWIRYAKVGNPQVGIKLTRELAKIAEQRRAVNVERADELRVATRWVLSAAAVTTVELLLALTSSVL